MFLDNREKYFLITAINYINKKISTYSTNKPYE